MKTPAAMLVLDLDGVVTDPKSSAVSRLVLVAVVADLKRGVSVAFNTGRALDWVEQNIFPRLTEQCPADELSRLLVVAEKGGVLGFAEEGRLRVELDLSLAPPADFRQAAQNLLDHDQGGWRLSETMFWDAAKQTMISVERRPEVSLNDFHKARETLVTQFEDLIATHRLRHFKIDPTTIATDIEHERAGKHLGAEHVLTWLKQEGIAPQSFTAIGDSPSDAAMAEVFIKSAPTTFVYVGDPAKFKQRPKSPYKTVITGGGYSRDTARYLAQWS